ncbi:uncharacterized protein Z520_12078 [Fonsecaea multimorphosa CBS 102226]|uniref:FAS1 domain-containing protein n=1 Tax=Fonsecaea multimorphosa CBS 102226 TaxID=1442371 RepID=A0A0D2JGA9_9EURO|nr:uncharacterized protein Z520_12078 [Fonsecaea multimorphosa CBS 102226]KIX92197.1 hypothetical protein Z520_12078 [Fonsecaea multimorphosa CBS 102226]OAL17573.1 hypothetical protein AYO22_11491 [Fonsecaea multimorphosa]
MATNGLVVAALAAAVLAQTSVDLITVLNSTNGTSTISQVVSEVPGFLDAIAGKTNLTFLAPNDTAIATFLDTPAGQAIEDAGDDYLLNLLLYHVIDGGYNNITDYYVSPTLLTSSNYTNVTGGQNIGIYYDDDENVVGIYGGLDYSPEGPPTPIPFSQGWIYVINGVLKIPPSVSVTVTSGDFNGSSFVTALNETGLTEQVDLLHDATYIIPDNDGFETVQQALSDLSTEQLAEVLKYHVVAGKVWHFDDLQNGTQLTTLQGQSLTVSVTPAGDYFINNAGINYVDLAVSEGLVIFVDNVLNPNASWTPPVNGTEDGVPAWPISNTANNGSDGSSTASASSTLAAATFTGLAAAPLKTGAVGAAVIFGGAALAFVL